MKLVYLLLLVGFCYSAQAETKVSFSKTADVRHYKTYQWLAPRLFTQSGIYEEDARFAPVVRRVFDEGLAARGYVRVAEGGELQLLTAATAVKSSQLEGFLVMYGFDSFSGYYGPMTASPVTRINREGVLVVALYDPKTKTNVWSGYDTQGLGKPGSEGGAVNKAAGKLLKKLPKRN
jgi:hypothetical protein